MRKKFKWSVRLQSDRGEVLDREVEAYWDPEKESTSQCIGEAAAAEAYMEIGKQTDPPTQFAPIVVIRGTLEETQLAAA